MRMGIAIGRAAPSTSRPNRAHRGLRALAGFGLAAALLAGAPAVAQTAIPAGDEVPTPVRAQDAGDSVLSAPSPRIVALTRENPGADPVSDSAVEAEGTMRPSGPAEDVLTVFLDHAKIIRLPEGTQTVIIGNPFIADITVQRNGIVVVTGKSYGATNLIALDPQGLLLAESMVSVQAPTDSVVVVQRGLARESYSCTPNCQPSLRLGDAAEFFGAVGGQATQRSGFAVQAR